MVEVFKNWMNYLKVVDCWREHHPTEKSFTWTRGNVARRLDYILLDLILESKVINTSIKNIGFSDHRAVTCTLSMQKNKSGRSHYKLNTNFLKDGKTIFWK